MRTILIIFYSFVTLSTANAIDTLKIDIKVQQFDSLISLASDARSQGFVSEDLKVKFPIVVSQKNGPINGTIRIKSITNQNEKPSYRVKLKDGNHLGMRKFSLFDPNLKGGVFEKLFHQVMVSEGVMTTNYDFVYLVVNKEYKGIYAIEEHFDNSLFGRFNKRECVIMKLNDDAWSISKFLNPSHNNQKDILFNLATIEAFDAEDWQESNRGKLQYLNAIERLQKLKNLDYNNLEHLIDVDAFAKYYALCNVFKVNNGLKWNNQRFYFNPLTELLEPIAFSCFDSLALAPNYNSEITSAHLFFNAQLFNNKQFKFSHLKYLKKYLEGYSFSKGLETLLKQNKDLSALLKKDGSNNYDLQIKLTVEEALSKLLEGNFTHLPKSTSNLPDLAFLKDADKKTRSTYIENLGMTVNVNSITDEYKLITVINNLPLAFEITGFYNSSLMMPANEVIPAASLIGPEKGEFSIPKDMTHIAYKSLFSDERFANAISFDPIRFKKQLTNVLTVTNPFINSKDTINIDSIVSIEGDFKFKGKQFVFNEGAELRISNGSVTLENCSISSNDKPAFGIIVSKGELRMEAVTIENCLLDTNSIRTGFFTVYDSKFDLDSVIVENVNAEDAINFVNSNGIFNRGYISNVTSDALDFDFCTTELNSMVFNSIGNDAIDCSGTTLNGKQIKITKAGDKGVSAGEQSNITLISTSIKNCVIGAASKDGSMLIVQKSTLHNCELGLNAFRKKPYFTGGTIVKDKVKFIGCFIDQEEDEHSIIGLKK